MPFEKISAWFPNQQHIDPRISEKFSTGAKYAVISISKHPTYAQLKNSGGMVADTRMLGLISSFNAPQVRPVFRLFELGSRYPYSVAGKFMGSISLSSMMFDAGANIIGSIYEEVFRKDEQGNVDSD